MRTVEQLIKTKADFRGYGKYVMSRYGWVMDRLRCTNTGIYFISIQREDKSLDILKVGKAEGKLGFSGRFSYYNSDASNRANTDRCIKFMHNSMQTVYNKYGTDIDLVFHTLDVPMQETTLFGYTVSSSVIRSLEEQLSRQAKREGHSMILCGQD